MTRALLTETERDRIQDTTEETQRKYEAVSRVRRRVREELPTDIEILQEHHPTLYSELKNVICEEEQ